MEWVVETVLPQEVWKLLPTFEERDVMIALIHDDLRDRDN